MFTLLVFRMKTGVGWRDLPIEMGASQSAVRRRLKEWTEQGPWELVVERLLTRLKVTGRLELAEVLIDGGLLKAPCGGEKPPQPHGPGPLGQQAERDDRRPRHAAGGNRVGRQ